MVTTTDLDLYDLAFLWGGPERVIDTAVVALVRRGNLRVHRPGQLTTADPARRHPVEAAVLDAVGPTGGRSVDMVCWRLVGDDRLRDIGRGLRDRGLVVRRLGVGRGGSLVANRAGRRLRAEVGQLPGVDAEAMRVARGGRAEMASRKLRAEIFEPPDNRPVVPRSRRPFRTESPEALAHRAANHGVAGGIAIGGAFDGGGGGGDGGI
jgi:hypothetical protein